MYATTPLTETLWQITLAKPDITHLPYARPNHVYLIKDEHVPALINAGHPSQFNALKEALDHLGCPIEQIERLIITSWRPDCLGGVVNFPNADAFVLSPDMIQPNHYQQWIEQERKLRLDFAEQLQDFESFPYTIDMDALQHTLTTAFPDMPGPLNIIPVRTGHTIAAGHLRLEVYDAQGPDEGHMMLYARAQKWLFSGDIIHNGLPEQLYEVRLHLRALERADDLDVQWVLPNHDRVIKRAKLRIKHARLFLENFIDNAPLAMHNDPTLLEFVHQDLGIEPRDIIRYIETVRTYRILLEELGRSRLLDTKGEGLLRRYGVGLNDPRAPIRQRRGASPSQPS